MSKQISNLLLVLACAFTFCTLGLTNTIHADDIYVKTPANGGSNTNGGTSWGDAVETITHAINNLLTGKDTIHVAAGTYTENITFAGNLTLWGGYPQAGPGTREPETNITTIDGGGTGSVVTFNSAKEVAQYYTWTDTVITCLIPAAATTGNVKVTVGGTDSNNKSYTIV